MLFIADIHLYREHLYWFIAEVWMCDCLYFISVIRDVNSAAGIVTLRISLCDNQAVILPEHNSLNQLAKDLEIMFENYVEGFEAACVVSRNAKKFRPGDTAMQRAGDVLYRPQHYHMNIEEGLDLSGKTPTALVQRLVPSVFKEPKNILYTLDAREMRDPEHKTEAGRAAGMRLAAQIDSDLISMVTQRATNVITMADSTTGSQGRDLWNCAAGIDATMTAIGVPQGINRRSFWNPFNYKDLAGELGHRAYAQGATLTAYEKAQIPPVASFDSYKTDISGRVPKGTATSITLAAAPAHKVEAKDANDMPVDIGSLAEAANQKGDFAQNAAKNAGVNLAAQGVLSAAAKGIGRGITAIKGDIAPEVAKKIATSESMGVTPMTSDVIPPKNAFTRGLTQDAEGALLGTGSKRAEQYATRSKLVSNYFDRFGEYNPDDVVKSLTTTLRGRKDAAGAVINDVTNKMGNAAVDTTNTMNALNTAIARQERLGTSANQSLLTSLRNLREELANPATDLDVTFDLLRQHRTAFRSNVQGDAMVFPNQAKAATNMVENAMSKDLRNAVAKNLGASDAAKYLKANSDYANVYNKVLNKNIANKLNKASSEASPELINTVVLSRKPSDVKRIWSALDDKGKDAMRAAYVSKIAEKAGDSPAKFITEVNKLKSQSGGEIYNTIFSGKHMKELDALHEVLQQTARSDTANVVTQTGQSQANRIRTIGATATLGVSMGIEAGFGAMMRLYESKAARNALLRLANTKAGTPAYERALNNAANAIRPILANDATDR
ncbi:hypothetical protein ESCOMMO164M2_12895 [Escherichia coli]